MKNNRRDFIKNASMFVGGTLIAPYHINLPTFSGATAVAKGLRRSLHDLADDDPDLISYKRAVQVMKSRPATDPLSWEFQAKIHARFCPHQNWYFLPWHRAYLKYFEDVCRQASGNKDFNLPYWDWTKFPQFPKAFVGDLNPLNDDSRTVGAKTARAEMVGIAVIDQILKSRTFEEFGSYKSSAPRGSGGGQSRLESSPHNHIHMFVGGKMSSPPTAAFDPIFYLHHANIDRLWAMWNDAGNLNTDDTSLTDYILKGNFADSSGKVIDVRVGDFFDVRKLGYTYDTQTAIAAATSVRPLALNFASMFSAVSANETFTEKSKVLDFTLKMNNNLASGITQMVNRKSKVPSKSRVKVIIDDVDPPADPNFLVRVFLNCDYLSEDTPVNDPHYAGTFTFFGNGHVHSGDDDPHSGHNHTHDNARNKFKYILDITDTLEKVNGIRELTNIKEDINIQLLTVGLNESTNGRLLAGKIEIIIVEETL